MTLDAGIAAERVESLRPSTRRHPAPGHRGIPRWRLLERLSRTPLGGVVLVSAPAGSGKTFLLRSWVETAGLGDRVAWVSIERGKGDPQAVWLAVVDELGRAAAGDGSIHHISPAPGFRGQVLVDTLIPQLQRLKRPVVLVLDDLDELEVREGLTCLQRFLDRCPPQVRVVLSTRAEPRLELHRLRLAGALTEIRDRDLRFSLQETRELLEDAGITLCDRAVTLLHERTEGWAAGLRLAALSLAGHPDPERFVTEFCGGERAVAEYLLAEVLDRQPPDGRELLLRTSMLDRVNGPLADVLTGRPGSERILQGLEDRNAFVMSLDAGRTWFRYHQLFADLLQRELRRTNPTIIDALHRAASRWYEEHGSVVDAIRHAQAARDWPHAARLLADHDVDLILDGKTATTHELLAAFPRDMRAGDAELVIASAGVAIADGLLDEGDVYLRHGKALAHRVREERRRPLELRIVCRRLWLASWRGDMATVPEAGGAVHAALDASTAHELPLSNDVEAMALMHLGIAELWSSQIDDARDDLERALGLARRIERPYLEVSCLAHLGIASALAGSGLSVMRALADEAIALCEAHGWSEHRIIDVALAARGNASVWLGRFEEAERILDRAERGVPRACEPGLVFILHSGHGLLRLAQNRLDEALAEFTAAQEVQRMLATEHTLTLELHSRVIRTHVALGDVSTARACLDRTAPQLRDRAIIRIAEATVCLAEGEPQKALDLLTPALASPDEPGHLPWAPIQALLCDAAVREQLGDAQGAGASLDKAIALATPEQIVLPFVLPGTRDVVTAHAGRRTGIDPFLATILEVIAGTSRRPCPAATPCEELSPAERRVLAYLPSNLNAGEIAAELYVSANTVRTHVRHIYAKLDAHTRGEAVARARERGILVGH